jgi:outer membrane biosynthesis protein TonB
VFGWWRDYFVPEANGGGLKVAEVVPAPETEAAVEETEAAVEETEDAEPEVKTEAAKPKAKAKAKAKPKATPKPKKESSVPSRRKSKRSASFRGVRTRRHGITESGESASTR